MQQIVPNLHKEKVWVCNCRVQRKIDGKWLQELGEKPNLTKKPAETT